MVEGRSEAQAAASDGDLAAGGGMVFTCRSTRSGCGRRFFACCPLPLALLPESLAMLSPPLLMLLPLLLCKLMLLLLQVDPPLAVDACFSSKIPKGAARAKAPASSALPPSSPLLLTLE